MSKVLAGRKPKGDLVKEIDAAITLLTRVRALAASATTPNGTSEKAEKHVSGEKQTKRVLSASAREAIAVAQRKRWAKVKRQKKQAERAALSK
jgi:hypothetical protein